MLAKDAGLKEVTLGWDDSSLVLSPRCSQAGAAGVREAKQSPLGVPESKGDM